MSSSRSAAMAHTVPMVTKALEVVRLLASSGDTTTKALAARLGLPRSSCYRILRSLIAQDWVRPVEDGRHELSFGLMPLLHPLRQIEALVSAARPALESLARQTQLTAKLSVRQGDDAVTVARCESPSETSVAVRVGAAFHLAFGSSGTVLLWDVAPEEAASLLDRAPAACWAQQDRQAVAQRRAQLRENGWCADLGTFRASVHALSAPVRGAEGKVAAALTVVGFPQEITESILPGLGGAVIQAAQEVSRVLQRRTP